jgi:putative addiction module component (TIGR02574 family)
LLESLNAPTRADIEQAWAEEAERRIEEIELGNVDTIPGEQVFREIRERLRK